MPPKKNSVASKASTTLRAWWEFMHTLFLIYITDDREVDHWKKAVKSAEFIDDQAEEL